jgi:hypothetical protein
MQTTKPITKAKMKLVGEDGNAFFIMGRTRGAMKKAGVSEEVMSAYQKEAMAGDYDNLLQVTMKYIKCD